MERRSSAPGSRSGLLNLPALSAPAAHSRSPPTTMPHQARAREWGFGLCVNERAGRISFA